MFKTTPDLSQLLASRRRPAMGADYSFVVTREPSIRRALALASESIFGIIKEHASIAGELTFIPLTAERKAGIAKHSYEEQSFVLELLAQSLRRATSAPEFAEGLEAVPPERLEGWGPQLDLYARIGDEGQSGLNLTLDLRLELDAFAWYTVRTVMQGLVQKLEDPQVPEPEREALRDGFRDFLAYKDLALKSLADSKEQLGQADRDAQARIEAARKDELVMQVQYAVAHGQPVDQALLEEAAQWWHERKAQTQGGAG